MFLNNGGVDSKGNPVGNADVTWSTSDASIVSVDATTGIITAKAVGTVTITATDKNEAATTGSTSITTYNAPIGDASVRVGHNTDLGTPRDADPNDDIIITRRQYTLSYNASHGDPNWVSWNLDASHKGGSARCNCFTADPEVAKLGLPAYNTSDWINGGTWSRGHMSPSADWTDADGDNAPTFYLSNMLPQNQTLNGGAWGDLENHLRDLATGTTEIYIISGGIFTKNRSGAGVDGFGFMNSTGHIAVPDSIWKIAIVVPDGRNVASITNPADVQVIAANFPNEASGTGSWTSYATTIDKIQKSTGYDFLSSIPEAVQCRLESRNCAPTARITSDISANQWQSNEGQSVTFDASTSSDPNAGDILSYQWSINGQTVGVGPTLTRTFANDGTFDVQLIVADDKGASDIAHVNVTVLNVAPALSAIPGANLLTSETYSGGGSFTDPGADTFSATADYGDGSGAASLALSGKTFSLSHTYTIAGTFTVTVSVNDGSATRSTASTVVVKTPIGAIVDLDAMVTALGDLGVSIRTLRPSSLNAGQLNSLRVKLQNASKQLAAGNTTAGVNTLNSFLDQLHDLVASDILTDDQIAPIVALTKRVIASATAH
jgi:DNA/RNA endonuclease G (NUC1)